VEGIIEFRLRTRKWRMGSSSIIVTPYASGASSAIATPYPSRALPAWIRWHFWWHSCAEGPDADCPSNSPSLATTCARNGI